MTNKKQINPRRPIPASGYDRLRENLSSNFRQDTERFPEPQGFPMNEFPLPDNRANINRGTITSRKDDTVQDVSIGLMDHDEAVMYYFNEVIKPYTPQAIVFFCGTNDIAALKTPEETIDDFEIFLTKVRNNLPNTHVFVIGIKPSVARDYLKEEELTYNNTILEMSQKDKLLTFVDVWEPMLTEDGKPNPDLFVEDGLHMNEKGYVIWTRLVRESLGQYFNL